MPLGATPLGGGGNNVSVNKNPGAMSRAQSFNFVRSATREARADVDHELNLSRFTRSHAGICGNFEMVMYSSLIQ